VLSCLMLPLDIGRITARMIAERKAAGCIGERPDGVPRTGADRIARALSWPRWRPRKTSSSTRPSACSSQKHMFISRRSDAAALRCARVRCGSPVRRYSRPRLRWQRAESGRMPSSPARASTCPLGLLRAGPIRRLLAHLDLAEDVQRVGLVPSLNCRPDSEPLASRSERSSRRPPGCHARRRRAARRARAGGPARSSAGGSSVPADRELPVCSSPPRLSASVASSQWSGLLGHRHGSQTGVQGNRVRF
jgi:hypothetical protein